jgi:hypothetical protein
MLIASGFVQSNSTRFETSEDAFRLPDHRLICLKNTDFVEGVKKPSTNLSHPADTGKNVANIGGLVVALAGSLMFLG